MYHPSRGGVRGGRDRKDLHWYARDKKSKEADMEAAKEEIRRIKEEEEQAMREALGLAPKRSAKPQGNRLDKHEFSELVKRGSTAEDLGAGHAEAAHVQGLGFAKAPKAWEESSSAQPTVTMEAPKITNVPASPSTRDAKEDSEDESRRKKRRREEKKHEKHERREERKHERREKRHTHESDDKRKHKKDKDKRRHNSD
ncbi:Kinase phosphorylation domain-containing protein [Cynara cardunculus var. scolymus]|uniref:Kinase phosphorylation domain-containing protein n=1 Tax=Cynara cardunculus var. scolymus TaxID=59895 RepID=A0A103YE33_CYNCS|nr:Kinase phosphorylation domain-containing protein [Cynara cardunculus var. scolymus]